MKLRTVGQPERADLCGPYDAVICSSGYESRARFVASQLAKGEVAIGSRYVLAFKEHDQALARPENDKRFRELGYKSLPCSGRSAPEVREYFESALLPLKDLKTARLLVDISSMTRAWYGEIIHTLLALSQPQELRVDFAYAVAEFVPPLGEYPPNRVAGPVPGFFGLALPDKPTALGIGLGYHLDRAIGLKDYLDPKLTVLFYPNPSMEPSYVKTIQDTNREILGEVSENNIIAYPVKDCVATFGMVNSLCEGLMRSSRVVLCSLGPKIFSLCCFLVAAIHRDISIWRVGADDFEAPFDHKPSGALLVLETIWEHSATEGI